MDPRYLVLLILFACVPFSLGQLQMVNVTVYIDELSQPTKGKIAVTLNGPSFAQEVPIQPHMTDLVALGKYSALAYTPYDPRNVTSVTVSWRKKLLGNFFGAKRIAVHYVSVEPAAGSTPVYSPTPLKVYFCKNSYSFMYDFVNVEADSSEVLAVRCSKIRP